MLSHSDFLLRVWRRMCMTQRELVEGDGRESTPPMNRRWNLVPLTRKGSNRCAVAKLFQFFHLALFLKIHYYLSFASDTYSSYCLALSKTAWKVKSNHCNPSACIYKMLIHFSRQQHMKQKEYCRPYLLGFARLKIHKYFSYVNMPSQYFQTITNVF